jgi:hypothetical protein
LTAVSQSVSTPKLSMILPTHFMQAGSLERLGRLLAGMISTCQLAASSNRFLEIMLPRGACCSEFRLNSLGETIWHPTQLSDEE